MFDYNFRIFTSGRSVNSVAKLRKSVSILERAGFSNGLFWRSSTEFQSISSKNFEPLISLIPLAPNLFSGSFSNKPDIKLFAAASKEFGIGTDFDKILFAISCVEFSSPSTCYRNITQMRRFSISRHRERRTTGEKLVRNDT